MHIHIKITLKRGIKFSRNKFSQIFLKMTNSRKLFREKLIPLSTKNIAEYDKKSK